ncbi:ligand-binding sensor domain-containing protein [Brumimicrobium mesophilum]|uniref:ligand-binding sensor domain-containing protein n=1 Tax=Brumimicrobium mesophilum TaxID=392717 RepID=UPI000D1449D6|nr:two-component regulator propeller domain-containing protein [Brumimicrobium mesophilum]
MYLFQRIQAGCFTLIFLFIFNPCIGQNNESFPVLISKVHKDSISLKAETEPEYRNNINDKDYQGNQISGVIRTVFQDSKGDFWFGTQNGLCRYDKNGLVYFELKDSQGKNVTVHVVIENDDGNIWIGYGGGIAKFDGTFFTIYHEKDILTVGGLWSMKIDQNGLIWVGTTQGVYTFNGLKLTPFEIPEGKINPAVGVSTSKMIHSIIEDSKGRMWFATNGGVFIYNDTILKNISENEGLSSNFVNDIIESENGDFWISTSNGIFKYNEISIKNITEKLIGKGDGIGCIFEDNDGQLWFSVNKREIYRFDGVAFTEIKSEDNDFMPFPFSMFQDDQKRLWFVGLKGAFRYENNNFVNVNRDGPW